MDTNNGTALVPTEDGTIARREFGASQVQKYAETSALAVAAHAKALVEARFVMALQRPRDFDDVRQKLLKACKRTGFAKTSRYAKPVGGQQIVGWTIRFAEECIRSMGNLLPEVTTVFDDDSQRIVRVTLADLEANIAYTKDVVVRKTVERSSRSAGEVVGERVNKQGKAVFIIKATDDDLLNKENSLVSKTLRNHALRLIPGDVLDDCLEQVYATLDNEKSVDPDAERKKLADGFAALNVMPSDLKEYLGHDLAQTSPAEMKSLRLVFQGLRDGETTWLEVMRMHEESKAKPEPTTAPSSAPPKTTADLKAKAKADKEKKTEPAAAGAPEHKEDCATLHGGKFCDCGADPSREPPVSA